VHKDSNRRDNEANSSSRRKLLTATGLGAVSVAASSLLGQNPAASQTAAKPDRQALQNQELAGKTALLAARTAVGKGLKAVPIMSRLPAMRHCSALGRITSISTISIASIPTHRSKKRSGRWPIS
jgi:glucose/arabinose dehydrogenase